MKIHEYQAKRILSRYGVPVPRGDVAATPAEARAVAETIGPRVVVKAQIHAGGRGKGGGIKLAAEPRRRPNGWPERSSGHDPGHPSDGTGGQDSSSACWSRRPSTSPASSTSASSSTGRSEAAVLMASTEGGMEIEKVAAETPDRIYQGIRRPRRRLRRPSRPASWPSSWASRARRFKQARQVHRSACIKAFEATDASLAEINPLVVTKDGRRPGPRRQDELRRQRPVPPSGHRWPCATWTRNRPSRSRPPSSTSTTSSSTATSAAWSTAPAWPWPPWTSSSTRRHAGQLPRRRRRRHRGGGDATPSSILVADPDVKGALINIFGGIVRCDMIATRRHQGRPRAGHEDPGRRPPGGHQRRAGQEDPGRVRAGLPLGRQHEGRGGEGRGPGQGRLKEQQSMSILIDENTKVVVQGITGERRHLPRHAHASNTGPRSWPA